MCVSLPDLKMKPWIFTQAPAPALTGIGSSNHRCAWKETRDVVGMQVCGEASSAAPSKDHVRCIVQGLRSQQAVQGRTQVVKATEIQRLSQADLSEKSVAKHSYLLMSNLFFLINV